MRRDTVVYEVDGLTLRSELFVDEGQERRPGVLVYPHAFGMDRHALDRAERLAEMGYAALACDLHGQGAVMSDTQAMMEAIGPLLQDSARSRNRALASFEALSARPEVDSARIAATGYCLGGTMALEVARSGVPLAAAVCFHGGLRTTQPAQRIDAEVLALLGADDPLIGPEERRTFEEEMTAIGARWQINLYGGVRHSYTDPEAEAMGAPDVARYDPWADERSWAEMSALLARCLGT